MKKFQVSSIRFRTFFSFSVFLIKDRNLFMHTTIASFKRSNYFFPCMFIVSLIRSYKVPLRQTKTILSEYITIQSLKLDKIIQQHFNEVPNIYPIKFYQASFLICVTVFPMFSLILFFVCLSSMLCILKR